MGQWAVTFTLTQEISLNVELKSRLRYYKNKHLVTTLKFQEFYTQRFPHIQILGVEW
jgi:hypothetical protein